MDNETHPAGGVLMPQVVSFRSAVTVVAALIALGGHAATLEYRFAQVETSQRAEEKSIRRIERILCHWCTSQSPDKSKCASICLIEE